MLKKIYLIYLTFALLTSTAAICTAQSWGEGTWDLTKSGWDSENTRSGWEVGNNGGNEQSTDSWGSPPPAEVTEPSDEAYFPTSISESSSTLIEEQPTFGEGGLHYVYYYGGGGSSKNIFWIVCGTGHWSSVNIPCGRYARLLIIPSTSGQLIMEELYPNGQVQTYYSGYVKAQKQYKKWFLADKSGIHRMRYRIDNGPYSDILTFHVGPCGGCVDPGCGGCGDGDCPRPVCPCCHRPY